MRRLLTSGEANPTITTVLDVLAAVGLRLTLSPSSASKPASVALTSKPVRKAILSTSKPVRKRAGDAKPQHRKTA